MNIPDTINIPAYQRKRSLAAKARKSGANVLPKTRNTKPKTTRPRLVEDVLTDIPIRESLPSASLFPDTTSNTKKSEIIEMKVIGQCEGYFDKIDVAIIKLTSAIHQDDLIIFEKQGGLFQQPISSMQIDRKEVKIAHAGDDIGMKVAMAPKVGAPVYKVI